MAGKQDAAAKKAAAKERKAASRARRRQIFEAFNMQRREDKLLIPLMLAAVLGLSVLAFGVGYLFDVQWMALPLGIGLGLLLAVVIFGRRIQRTVYGKAEGQPGAAGWALDTMRGNWQVTQAVAGTTHLDALHRVIGRPGVILVGEGAPHRVKTLVAQEKKRIARLIGDTPIYDVIVGNEPGQVPLRSLQRHLAKLPRNISTSQMTTIEGRLNALANKGGAALPKGPMPQGAKMRSMQRTVRRRG